MTIKDKLILFIIGYIGVLIINTAQIVSLYIEIVEDPLLSPWLSLFVLDLAILLFSFRGNKYAANTFAVIIGLLDIASFMNAMPDLRGFEYVGILGVCVLFSGAFAYSVYFFAEEIARMFEDIRSGKEESLKKVEEGLKKREVVLKEVEEGWRAEQRDIEERRKYLEGLAKKKEESLKKREEELKDLEAGLKAKEEMLKESGKKVKYGNSFVKVEIEAGKITGVSKVK